MYYYCLRVFVVVNEMFPFCFAFYAQPEVHACGSTRLGSSMLCAEGLERAFWRLSLVDLASTAH